MGLMLRTPRIVRVDLKFPPQPAVSEAAKDFIKKVRPPAANGAAGGRAMQCRSWHALLEQGAHRWA